MMVAAGKCWLGIIMRKYREKISYGIIVGIYRGELSLGMIKLKKSHPA